MYLVIYFIIFFIPNKQAVLNPKIIQKIQILEKKNIPYRLAYVKTKYNHMSSLEDIKKIKSLSNSNIEGVIVGKSIYDGDIKISDLAKLI